MDFLTNALSNAFLAGYMHCAIEHNVMTEEAFVNELKKNPDGTIYPLNLLKVYTN